MTDGSTISIVVTAPRGVSHCPYLDAWRRELATHSAELIVADATDGPIIEGKDRVRHLQTPGAALQQLIAHAATHALGEWILVTEDHCRPLEGVLGRYLGAIEKEPHADLIAGGVDNLTNPSPWSWAIFAIGLSEHWRNAPGSQRSATNANFLLRRSAIREEELAARGGVLNGTLPRLIAEGRFAACPGAAIDHVVEVDRKSVIAFEYACTREAIDEGRLFAPQRGKAADAWHSFKGVLGCALIMPLRTSRNTRGTHLDRLPHHLRVAYVCAAVAARLARDDVKRLTKRSA